METRKLNVAVLSGKGGTGKTLVSVNLANVSNFATYMDCDVEEPNGYLFFKPSDIKTKEVYVPIPNVKHDLCDGCRECVEFCKFNALAYVAGKIKVFENICHSCGGCSIVCKKDAVQEKMHAIGQITQGISDKVTVVSGKLNEGEASGVPIINELLSNKDKTKHTFIDCPPGSACSVMESIKDADYCVLVAEPTVFGVHNLKMVYELLVLFDKKFGVVINKSNQDRNLVKEFCDENDIDIVGNIPFDKNLGLLNSNGKIVSNESQGYRGIFTSILDKVMSGVNE